jgi:hypothetical protein
MQEHLGKTLLSGIAKDFPVNRSFVGDKQKPPQINPEPKKPVKKPEYFGQTQTTSSGVKVFRFQKNEKGLWELIGEVGKDGTLSDPTPPASKPNQDPADQPQPKAKGDNITLATR